MILLRVDILLAYFLPRGTGQTNRIPRVLSADTESVSHKIKPSQRGSEHIVNSTKRPVLFIAWEGGERGFFWGGEGGVTSFLGGMKGGRKDQSSPMVYKGDYSLYLLPGRGGREDTAVANRV